MRTAGREKYAWGWERGVGVKDLYASQGLQALPVVSRKVTDQAPDTRVLPIQPTQTWTLGY